MTRRKILFICYLILLYCAAKITYRKFYCPQTVAAKQEDEAVKRARLEHEEAIKRARLEADLKKALETDRRKSNQTSQRSTRRT